MDGIVVIIIIVATILGIVLFFKVWGMTNNVKDIKESGTLGVSSSSESSSLDEEYEYHVIMGDTGKARDSVIRWFASRQCGGGGDLEKDLEIVKDRFQRLGVETPEHLSSVEAFAAFMSRYRDGAVRIPQKPKKHEDYTTVDGEELESREYGEISDGDNKGLPTSMIIILALLMVGMVAMVIWVLTSR